MSSLAKRHHSRREFVTRAMPITSAFQPMRRLRVALLMTLGAVGLAGCGGGSSGGSVPVTASAQLASCDSSLASSFQSPIPGTQVLLAHQFTAGQPLLLSGTPTASTRTATSDVCVVKLLVPPGNTGPASAPSTSAGIGIEVWLPSPSAWNGLIHNVGGGGWQGGAATSLTQLGEYTNADGMIDPASVAMGEGAVSAITDTGHPGGGASIGDFAMNPDGSINTVGWNDFAVASLHDTAVISKALAQAFYGHPAKYAFYDGFSTGGRQGLKEAQAYPTDYNGILSGAPAINWTNFITAELYPQIVVQRDLGGVPLTSAQLASMSNAAIGSCDVVNGVHLGYIPDPASCSYDPTTDPTVLCTANGGSNATSSCVTPTQAEAMNKFWYGQTPDGSVPAPSVNNGAGPVLATNQLWYGLMRGSNFDYLAGSTPFTIASDMVALELQDPTIATPSFLNATGNGQNLWQNLTYAQLAGARARGVALQADFSDINTDNPDLSGFQAAGGKLLLYHGLADFLIPTEGSVNYYNRVINQMGGLSNVQSFFRFYLIPGMGHGLVNGTSNPNANPPLPTDAELYGALTNWVENNQAPGPLTIDTAVTTSNPVQHSGLLCLYPQKASYVAGDPFQATSYACQ